MEHQLVSREEWLEARKAHLVHEKELTRARERLAAERRALPWVRLDKSYTFDTLQGKKTLGDLFEGRSQLVVKHFMLPPGQRVGCVGCSFEVDQVQGALVHLEHHDVSYVAVARAPLDEIEAFRRRMGWPIRWVSSFGSDFNYDFNVSFTPEQIAGGDVFYNYREGPAPMEDLSGHSIFFRNEAGAIFHTYSSFGRGGEEGLTAYAYLDMTPKGRNETGPSHNLSDWVRHHDKYDAGGYVDPNGRYHEADEGACCGCDAAAKAD